MSHSFDPGYTVEPFKTLVEAYPDETVYPPTDFRVEWGPIFHRGRLDGSAKVLVIGQDPAANETFVRRILVGVAGQRAQGFLARLGITRSYVFVNTFLYSVYGQQGGEHHRNDPKIAAYRHLWLDALLRNGGVRAVVSLGTLADSAWKRYRATSTGAANAAGVTYATIPHPTYPESAAKGNAHKLAQFTAAMLAKWNLAIATLRAALPAMDDPTPHAPYGDAFTDADLADIPEFDLPPGLPAFVRRRDGWAARTGTTAAQKRATLTLTVPGLAGPTPVAVPLGAAGRRPAPAALSAEAAIALAAAGHVIVHGPVDPAPAAKLALKGRVVTMASAGVIPRGVVYVDGGTIVAVQSDGAPPPAGFSATEVIDTKGTIYPGLIELHNHVSYNALRLWDVPKKYTNRDQWAGTSEYHKLVSGPMRVLGPRADIVPSLVRYVECKALVAGTTTTQGVSLSSNSGIARYYRGIVRNVEQTGEDVLPEATTHIADVESVDRAKFVNRLEKSTCLLLHLSEGTDAAARAHFQALQGPDGTWAITRALAGIHAAALKPPDFDILAQHDGAMVWSPLSNLLLYGDTANVKAAKAAGVRIGLGPDWSPSGSKNTLGELKAAKAWSTVNGGLFTDEELVRMVTTAAAHILGWQGALGSIEVGKKGDFFVLGPDTGDPYTTLVEAGESDVELVVINGTKRVGTKKSMAGAGTNLERITISGKDRYLNLANLNGDPIPGVTLASATKTLKDALMNLPKLAEDAEHPAAPTSTLSARNVATPEFTLALPEIESTGIELRPHLADHAHRFTGPTPVPARAAMLAATQPLSQILGPLTLDPLTAEDDANFSKTLRAEKNLPTAFRDELLRLY